MTERRRVVANVYLCVSKMQHYAVTRSYEASEATLQRNDETSQSAKTPEADLYSKVRRTNGAIDHFRNNSQLAVSVAAAVLGDPTVVHAYWRRRAAPLVDFVTAFVLVNLERSDRKCVDLDKLTCW